MKRSPVIALSVLALSVGLSACSTTALESKKIDYKSARKVDSLEIPPDLTTPTRDDRYAVPDVTPRGVATFSAYSNDRVDQAPTTVASAVFTPVDGMRMERAGSQRWLVVPGNSDALWLELKDFWQDNGFVLNIERPDIGIMETDWAENRANIPQDIIRRTLGRVLDQLYSTPVRDKFRTRLEEGRVPGTIEIYVSHRGVEEVYESKAEDMTVWQPRPPDPELEAEMLSLILVRLGANEELANEIIEDAPAADRARLITDGNASSLEVSDSFDRAWRRIGLALDRLGFAVEDRDRNQGLYFVRYIDPDADAGEGSSGGFLSSLAFWRSSDKDVAERGIEYRIFVANNGADSVVTVLTPEGGQDNSDTARRILTVLQEQLR